MNYTTKYFVLVFAVVSVLAMMRSSADDVEAAFEAETAAVNDSAKGKSSVKPAKLEPRGEAASPVRRSAETKQIKPLAPAKNSGEPDIAGKSQFIAALEKNETEAEEARKEIARLKTIIRKMVEVNRREKAIMHYNMGCVYKAGRLYNKAESEFKQALEITPDDPSIHYNLGVLYDDDLKDKAKAKEHYTRFLKLAPGDPDASKVEEWLMAIPGN